MGRMCVTREWNVVILTNFEKLSRRSQSFAQRKFLEQSWEHLFLIQQPEAESILKV